MAAGDFNDDGTPDLAVGTSTGVSVLLRNDDGFFQTPTVYDLNAYQVLFSSGTWRASLNESPSTAMRTVPAGFSRGISRSRIPQRLMAT